MTLFETIVICVALVAATVASILHSLTPELAGLLGTAVGYGVKGAVTALPTRTKDNWKPGP